jgi:hypothetical protein
MMTEQVIRLFILPESEHMLMVATDADLLDVAVDVLKAHESVAEIDAAHDAIYPSYEPDYQAGTGDQRDHGPFKRVIILRAGSQVAEVGPLLRDAIQRGLDGAHHHASVSFVPA